MKLWWILVIFVVGFFPLVHVQAQEKCPKLEDNEGYEKLRSILECLERQIDARGGVKAPDDNNASSVDAGRFSVSILGASIENVLISVSLSIKNKTNEPLLLALDGRDYPVIVDSGGKVGSFHSVLGIKTTYNDLNYGSKQENYTPILPGKTLNMNIRFNIGDAKFKMFNVTIPFLSLKGDKIEITNVSPGYSRP